MARAFLRAVSRLVSTPGWLLEYLSMEYSIHMEQDEDGVFVAICPTLPGCVSQGQTREEATANIREAIEGNLKSLIKHGDPIPQA